MNKKPPLNIISTLRLKNSFPNAINNVKNFWFGLKYMAYSKQSEMSTDWYEKSLKMEYYTMHVYVCLLTDDGKFVYFVKHEHRTKDVPLPDSAGRACERVAMCRHKVLLYVARWSSTRWPGQTACITHSHIRPSHMQQQNCVVEFC